MADNSFKVSRSITLVPQSGAPANPTNGDIYYDTSLNQFRKYENGAWGALGSNVDNTSAAFAINAQTGTTYTFALTDGSGNGNSPLVTLSNAASITATVPTNASVAFPIGTQITVLQLGAGVIDFIGASGVTVNALNGKQASAGQYAKCTLIKTATNTWDLSGDLAPGIITATGGTITTDGNFKVHTFTTSGTFQITSGFGAVESLVVAGGGGGGGQVAGGGGAGGLIHTSPGASYGVGSYTVTVGAGGSGGAAGTNNGSNGSNSVFDTITATGGGFGTYYAGGNGNAGGSGGGGGAGNGSVQSGGAGTAGQGNNGGAGFSSGGSNFAGGGGGGAGGTGATGTISAAGNGGLGLSVSITGAAVTYASGGGGGANGGATVGTASAGGGGNGSLTNGVNATANTGGGGGGGGGGTFSGGNGGSGVVIVRYQFQ